MHLEARSKLPTVWTISSWYESSEASWGYRDKTENSIRLAFLGGSTTFCAEVSGNELTWPAIVSDRLSNEYPKTPIDYINAGVFAYDTSISYKNLRDRVAQHDVDILFIYHGINDIVFDAYHRAVKEGALPANKVTSDDIPDDVFHKSVLADLVNKNILIHFRKKQTNQQTIQIAFNEKMTKDRFRYRLRKLVSAAREHSDLVVLPTFTNRLRDGLTAEQVNAAMMTHSIYVPFYTADDLLSALNSYNDVIREFSGSENVIVLETETAIAGTDENFFDSVHFNDKGSQLFGETIASMLISSKKIQGLMFTPSLK